MAQQGGFSLGTLTMLQSGRWPGRQPSGGATHVTHTAAGMGLPVGPLQLLHVVAAGRRQQREGTVGAARVSCPTLGSCTPLILPSWADARRRASLHAVPTRGPHSGMELYPGKKGVSKNTSLRVQTPHTDLEESLYTRSRVGTCFQLELSGWSKPVFRGEQLAKLNKHREHLSEGPWRAFERTMTLSQRAGKTSLGTVPTDWDRFPRAFFAEGQLGA